VGVERTWHRLGATLTVLLMTLAVPALAAAPSPEDTIAAIEAEAAATAAWMEARTAAYVEFLSNDPTVAEATAERDRAIFEMYVTAFQSQLTIDQLMNGRPDADVAAAGQEAISAVYETAAEESQMTRELYDEFVAGVAAATTTTTTASTTTTTASTTTTTASTTTTTTSTTTTLAPGLPPLPTTSTTLPGLPTTSTTTTTRDGSTATTTTTDGPATPSSGSTPTTIGAEPGAADSPTSTTVPTPPDSSSSAEQSVDGSSPEGMLGNLSTSELAIHLIGDQVPVGLELSNPESSSPAGEQEMEFGVIRGLIRLSLPAAITVPLVDLALLLRAVVAAFLSGMATLAWPAGTLSGFLFLYGIWRRVKRI
jgi:hypothetical protein